MTRPTRNVVILEASWTNAISKWQRLMAGENWILWTIRLSMFHYAVFLGYSITQPRRSLHRWLWTVACLFFVCHFVAAFHYYHGWSPTHAFEDTAKQTKATIGVEFGSGIYFSYLFLMVWCADVTWWWFQESHYRRRDLRISAIVHGFIFFIAFNGTIVFEDGAIRWAAIVTCVILAGLLMRRALFRSVENRPA